MTTLLSGLAAVDWRRIANVVGLLVLVLVVGLFVVASVPQLAGADESYVVFSDSMSPTIKAGAVVFVADVPSDNIEAGDIVTYQRGGEKTTPVTHRVVEAQTDGEQRSFITKGDANEDPDPSPVAERAVVGAVAFHVPLIGYVVSFANTELGVVALVVIPALVLIVLELREFWRATAENSDETTESDGIL